VDYQSHSNTLWFPMGANISRAFGRVLREYRLKSTLSQEALALEAGIDRTFVSMLERGKRQPTLGTVFRLAAVLRVSPATLVARTSAALE
jgi:transcriptional regulator with XRE-family HTH domain